MNWDDYKASIELHIPEAIYRGYEYTDIDCPKCGNKVVKNTTKILTSYPAQYEYYCQHCDWIGYAYG